MLHGRITKISGAEIPPVDVITFGSPCQDLSQIGTRNGFAGKKSSLFYQAMRIIEEMRYATNGRYPAFTVWENVAGAFSSNDRLDFAAMLRAFTGAEVSVPPRGWAHAGMVRGGCADTAWRLLDRWENPPSHSGASACSSWRILQASVPEKYYLSPGLCSRFLRLAVRAGCPPPREVEYLLLKQGGRYPSSDRFPFDGCELWHRSEIRKGSGQLRRENRSQLCLQCNGAVFVLVRG
ncbi:MAG: DNA cytosine methyltransferase [Butyricicoccus sp.]